METNTARFAKTELDILLKTVEEPIIAPFYDEILALCEKFGKSGQSGGSAPYTATALSKAIKTLCLQEPLCDITGVDEEWVDVSGIGSPESDIVYQNKRCSALFKNKDGAVWYLDAIIWKNQHGMTYGGSALLENGKKIRGSQLIKGFPFKPKTFYIDVIEEEVAPDDWVFHVKDEHLQKVFDYYKKEE